MQLDQELKHGIKEREEDIFFGYDSGGISMIWRY